jgi:hypothetical protein
LCRCATGTLAQRHKLGTAPGFASKLAKKVVFYDKIAQKNDESWVKKAGALNGNKFVVAKGAVAVNICSTETVVQRHNWLFFSKN